MFVILLSFTQKTYFMKKITLSAIIVLISTFVSQAQVLPSFQLGIKGGVNLSSFSTSNTFSSGNQAGYLAGIYARIGALGVNFEPELYYTSKMATVSNGSSTNTVTLNSIDVPLLIGYKVGAVGIGARIYTGPVASFILSDSQSFGNALGSVGHLNFKDQNYAWQFGAGLDVSKLSIDLRYEKGLSNLSNDGYDQKLDLFNLTLGLRIF
jgi:hypothetical protein